MLLIYGFGSALYSLNLYLSVLPNFPVGRTLFFFFFFSQHGKCLSTQKTSGNDHHLLHFSFSTTRLLNVSLCPLWLLRAASLCCSDRESEPVCSAPCTGQGANTVMSYHLSNTVEAY